MVSIKWADRCRQLIDFSGMVYNEKLYPTDLDGILEYKDKGYIFYEVKYKDAPLPIGQRLALERLVNDAEKVGKTAIAVVCEHQINDVESNVPLHTCGIRATYRKGRWLDGHSFTGMSVKELTDMFINLIE